MYQRLTYREYKYNTLTRKYRSKYLRFSNGFLAITPKSPCRPQASFCSPEGEETLRPPRSDLRSPGKISKLVGFVLQMET